MRKLKLVKVIVPEIIAYFENTTKDMKKDYRCTECGLGVADNYVSCPYCGSELDWENVKKPSQRFLRVVNKL